MHLTGTVPFSCCFAMACWAILSTSAWGQPNQVGSKGQSPNIIRPEYYTACDFFADGQTSQAAIVLETALSQSRIANNQRGIDSIPPLVKLGECYLEQCDIGMALERYDAALKISTDHTQRWLSLLKSTQGNTRPDTRIREVPWSTNARGNQTGAFNDLWPIAIGSNEMLLESNAGQGVNGKTISVDAIEILRCQAIALRRRNQLLGPLAKHHPWTRNLLETFSANVPVQSDVIQTSIQICRALAMLATGERVASAQLLNQHISLPSGLDHPLTAIALLALADIAVDANEIPLAEERAIQASIVAGRLGQMDHLAEALEYISETGFADGHDVVISKMIQQIVQWSASKSRMVSVRGNVEFARLAALVGDVELASKQCNHSITLLLPKQLVMPRAEAVIRYAQAKVAFLGGDILEGINKLVESTAYLRGDAKGIGSPALFQLDMAMHLTKTKALNDDVAKSVLKQLLRSPTVGHWRVHPLEQLDWLMVDKKEVAELLMEIELRTSREADLVGAMDDLVCQRVRRSNELESRVFDLQILFHGDNRFVSDPAEAARLRKQLPVVDQNVTKLQQLLAPFQANPKWDVRKWSEDESRRWESKVRLSAVQESLLWAAAISPLAVPEVFPPRHSQELLSKSLRPKDAVVMFASHGSTMRGYMYESGKWRSWIVGELPSLTTKITSVLDGLMTLKNRDGDSAEVKKGWGFAQRIELRNQLFPKEVWTTLIATERWIVVPEGRLWYVPFETFPLSDSPTSMPSLSRHRITFSPTLGLVPFLLNAKTQNHSVHGIDVHSIDFLSAESHRANELREELAGKKRTVIDFPGKPLVNAPSHFFKVTSDSICSFAPMNWDAITPVSDSNPNLANVLSWMRLPWGSPQSMLLAGVNAIPPAADASGDEWLRLTLPLIAQGTQQLTIARWPVGGESTAMLIRSFHENQQDLSVSESWQRSVLTLWEEQLEQRHEPMFKKSSSAKSESMVPGSHPLLWSGYLNIGDSK